MKGDDYWQGRHFWTHFVCGLVVGGILGARIAWGMFGNVYANVALGGGIALLFALAVGYWGDRLWHWLIQHWQ